MRDVVCGPVPVGVFHQEPWHTMGLEQLLEIEVLYHLTS
jgi:hypothetical protein